MVGLFQEPTAFERAPDGNYLVLDRRGHVVYRVPRTGADATTIVQIGPESGHIVGPSAFVLAGDRFMVAAGPERRESSPSTESRIERSACSGTPGTRLTATCTLP